MKIDDRRRAGVPILGFCDYCGQVVFANEYTEIFDMTDWCGYCDKNEEDEEYRDLYEEEEMQE